MTSTRRISNCFVLVFASLCRKKISYHLGADDSYNVTGHFSGLLTLFDKSSAPTFTLHNHLTF